MFPILAEPMAEPSCIWIMHVLACYASGSSPEASESCCGRLPWGALCGAGRPWGVWIAMRGNQSSRRWPGRRWRTPEEKPPIPGTVGGTDPGRIDFQFPPRQLFNLAVRSVDVETRDRIAMVDHSQVEVLSRPGRDAGLPLRWGARGVWRPLL